MRFEKNAVYKKKKRDSKKKETKKKKKLKKKETRFPKNRGFRFFFF